MCKAGTAWCGTTFHGIHGWTGGTSPTLCACALRAFRTCGNFCTRSHRVQVSKLSWCATLCAGQDVVSRGCRVTAGQGIVPEGVGPVPELATETDKLLAEFLAHNPDAAAKVDLASTLQTAGIPFDTADQPTMLAVRCAHAHACGSCWPAAWLSRAAIHGNATRGRVGISPVRCARHDVCV